VPEYIIDGKVINLHQYSLKKNLNFDDIENEKIKWITEKMENFIKIKKNTEIYSIMTSLATEFYEFGLSCIDLLKWIEGTEQIDSFKKYNIIMYFNNIKSEYRCEKLLILCILDYIINELLKC
jgi:hypothetical protein